MRDAFAQKVRELASTDERIVLLSGDIGNRMFDKFKADFPNRFYNCGVAEANMVTMAAGLASCGFLPVCYTIAPFLTYRCMEQIRLDLCYQKNPVILVGTGAGLSYGNLGATHHSLEDVGMLRTLDGMRVLCPTDSHELKMLLAASFAAPMPTYLRIGKKGESLLCAPDAVIEIGKPHVLKTGYDAVILSMGNTGGVALDAAHAVSASVEVVSMHTIHPLPTAFLEACLLRHKRVILVEEHGWVGGLRSAVAEYLMEHPHADVSVRSHAIKESFTHAASGEQEHLRHYHGLSKQALVHTIEKLLSS